MRKYILFGAGSNGINAFRRFGYDNVAYFCDNYLCGSLFCGKEIISFERLCGIHKNYIVVLTTTVGKYMLEMGLQLDRNGIPFVLLEDELTMFELLKKMDNLYGQACENYDLLENEFFRQYKRLEIAYIDTTRIGEMMALRIEMDSGKYNVKGTKTIFVPKFYDLKTRDTLLFDDERNANFVLYKKITEHVDVIDEHNCRFWSQFIKKNRSLCCFYDRYSHKNMMMYQQLDMYFSQKSDKKYLSWSDEEMQFGNCELNKIGLKSPFVTFYARSQKYLDTVFKMSTLHPNDSIRNQSIEQYKCMCENLKNRGIRSVRMGYLVDEEIDWENTIDYASNYRTEFLDLYLISKSEFFVSSPSGIQVIATMFNIPSVLVNLSVFTSLADVGHWLEYDRDIMIFQKIRHGSRYLTMREIFEIENKIPDHYHRMKYFLDDGYVFEQNTQQEIWEAVQEMLEKKNGTVKYSCEDEMLQARYWDLVNEFISKRTLTWYAKARVGRDFLRQNSWLLD